MRTFTPQEIEDAKWAIMKGIGIRQDARAFERKRNLTEAEVLARVPDDEKERFQRGKALYAEGAYRPE